MKYRKKPVVIEAMRWDGSIHGDSGADVIEKWSGGITKCRGFGMDRAPFVKPLQLYIEVITPHGNMVAVEGDWIIKGVQGEFYPCKHDVFVATYEEAGMSDADALVERLRARADEQERCNSYPVDRAMDREAADTLAALKAEVEMLSGVLARHIIKRSEQAARIAALEAGVKEAGDQFAFYADQHRAKGTDDGNAKAATNQQWADRLRALGASR